MAIDIGTEIRRALDTGKTVLGERETEKSLHKKEAKLVVLTKNMSLREKERIMHFAEYSKIPVIEFQGTGLELGAVCGKPFVVSSVAVKQFGKSKLLMAVKK